MAASMGGQVSAKKNNGVVWVSDESQDNFIPLAKTNPNAVSNTVDSFTNNLVNENLLKPTKVTTVEEVGDFNTEVVAMGGGNTTVFALFNGERAGRLRIKQGKNPVNGETVHQVSDILVNEEYRGNNIAQELYYAAVKHIGQPLYSDIAQTEQATTVWGKMVTAGYAEVYINPNEVSGEKVTQHVESITPNEEDVPFGFIEKYIKPNNWVLDVVDLNELLETDPDFKSYFDANERRYTEEEVMAENLTEPLVVFKGEVLDGYSRAAQLIRDGVKTTEAYQVAPKISNFRLTSYPITETTQPTSSISKTAEQVASDLIASGDVVAHCKL